jgi:phosphonate transport system substrate-binding protein
MTKRATLCMGAVAYDPKVVTIWEGFRAYFASLDLDFDFTLYSNYESLVEAHLSGHVDVAWNSPLAWLQTVSIAERLGRRAEAIAMRDTDLTSVIVVRNDSEIRSLADLKGRRVGVGAADSPQATLIPLAHIAMSELDPGRDFEVVRFDVLLGKHGDHVGGERDAAQALMKGEIDAACMIDGNHLLFSQEGTLTAGKSRILSQTATYDHCNFTVLDDAPADSIARFKDLLLRMSYDDAAVRPLLDLEGLKRWVDGRTHGYAPLEQAIQRFGTIDSFALDVADRLRRSRA